MLQHDFSDIAPEIVRLAENSVEGYKIDPADPDENEYLIDTSGNEYTYIIPLENLQTVATDVYRIPINFKAYTGYSDNFEKKNNSGTIDMQYSNYRITMTVGLMKTSADTSVLMNSDKSDFVIYTNARLLSDIVEPKAVTPTVDP